MLRVSSYAHRRNARRHLLVALSLPALTSPLAAAAQEAPGSLAALPYETPPVVITATRLPTPAEEVASSVTVVTEEEIARRQSRDLADVLREVPGLHMMQTGGPGGATSVFIRGTNPNHAKVLIDGMAVNDPSSPNGTFDFASLLAMDIERVEVLRGPQSGLYGSDAIGGVINVITKPGKGPFRANATVEGGSFDTFNQFGGVSGSIGRFNYAANIGHRYAGAVPVTPLDLLPPGRQRIDDKYENTTVSTRLGADLTENFGVSVVARYVDARLRFTGDDFSVFPSVPAASQSRSDTRQIMTRGEARLALFDGVFEQRLGVGYVDYRSRFEEAGTAAGPAAPTYARGDRVRLDWLGTVHLAPSHTLLLGLEQERDALRDSPISVDNTNRAGFIELQSEFAERFFASATLRVDDNERFGNVVTYRFAPAYLVRETGTKLKGSYGTGFKAPTLTQLFVDFPAFNFFGNPDLEPEESRGWDLGFEQSLADGAVTFGATYFANDVKNLIEINSGGTSLENRARAEISGVESFLTVKPFDDLTFRADYTYTLAIDEETDSELRRRPKHKASLDAAWQATDALTLSTTALYIGPRFDSNRDLSVPRLKVSGYTVFNVAASYALTDNVTLFGRVENLFNKRYEDPTGFQRPGLGVFAGIRLALDSGESGQ